MKQKTQVPPLARHTPTHTLCVCNTEREVPNGNLSHSAMPVYVQLNVRQWSSCQLTHRCCEHRYSCTHTRTLLVVQLQFDQKSLKAPVVTFIAFTATYHTGCCWQVTETKWPSTTSVTTACHLKQWPHIQLETPGGLPSPNQKKTLDFHLCPNSNQNIQK